MSKAGQHFTISVAGHTIAIDALYTRIVSMCDGFYSDCAPEVQISITEEDINSERPAVGKQHFNNDEYLETLVTYRKISELMLDYNTFLMHGAVIAIGKNAYMFTADSGTGKTTHIRKWIKNIDDAYVVNGDKPLIHISGDQAIACGTPWRGKERMGINTMVPLKAIVLMIRGENNNMKEISFSEAFPFLLQQTYRPADAVKMKKTLSLLFMLKERVRFFKYEFNNLKGDAFTVSYNTLMDKCEAKGMN